MRLVIDKSIEDILNILKDYIDDFEGVIKILTEFYLVNERHRYSKVAKYINENADEDEQITQFLLLNLDSLIRHIDKNKDLISNEIDNIKFDTKYSESSFNVDKLIKNLEKLSDHIELENTRIIRFERGQEKILSNNINKFNEIQRQSQDSMKQNAEKIEEKMGNTVISILGIFSAIIIAFFGGLNVLGNIFTYIPNSSVSIYRLIFMSCLTGLIVFNIIFMLLHFISKMLDKNMGRFCDWNLGYNAEYGNGCLKRFYYKVKIIMIRHPLMFWFNILIIFIMSGTVFIWLMSKLFNLNG